MKTTYNGLGRLGISYSKVQPQPKGMTGHQLVSTLNQAAIKAVMLTTGYYK